MMWKIVGGEKLMQCLTSFLVDLGVDFVTQSVKLLIANEVKV